MEQFLFLCLTVSSFLLKVNSQCLTQTCPNLVNPDLIYFRPEVPDTGKVNRHINTPDVLLQPPFNRHSGGQFTPNGQTVSQFSTYGAHVVQLPNNEANMVQLPTHGPNLVQLPTHGANVVQQPTNGANVARLPTEDYQNVQQTPANNLNRAPDRAFVPNVDNRQSEEDDDVYININQRHKVRLDQTAAALTNFSLNVMRVVNEGKRGNTIVSPYSIAALLSLLQQGATGLALEQISVALQMSQQGSAAAYRTQNEDIQSRHSSNTLRTANNIFVANGFSLNPLFRIVAQTDFSSDVTPTVFQSPNQAARQINQWVASKTDNKIDKLINPETLSSNTQMVLVNAIYFKGIWQIPFKPSSTKEDTFTLRDGTVKNVPFMALKRYFRAGLDKYWDAKVVVLPFEREEYSLMVMLPSELSNADDLIRSLTVLQLENYLNMKSIEVLLRLPKFTIREDLDLHPVLTKMGVTTIFNQDSGLSGLGKYQDLTPQISSAVHSATLTIDEQGGTGAAASGSAAVTLSNDKTHITIKLNRPFVVVLWDGKLKLPLFIGKIEDPTL